MQEPNRDLDWLNQLSSTEAINEFLKCCGSRSWATQMTERRPFTNVEHLSDEASKCWWNLGSDDWLEAFRSHPKIGEKKAAETVSDQSRAWSGQEQSRLANAPEKVLSELATLNEQYEKRFGFIFIVCASGKSSDEMLAILKTRLSNDPTTELPIAANEQEKITQLRLKKLIS
ncbi:MAG TPA: 2-oxo-4-hydroxy-4-carboxy-5-ureidoimidazoline decarboxylase [Pyrinomonadaceae bacterium]|nr:2-oxo-4-hydroxy-4-carboxy-5-ureidoimidazoline decarboxylase [Pyrinomonadaceae bacterium]